MASNISVHNHLRTLVWPALRTMMELLKLRVAALLTFVAIATAFVAARGAPPIGTRTAASPLGLHRSTRHRRSCILVLALDVSAFRRWKCLHTDPH